MKFFFPIPPTPSTSLCRARIFQAAHMLPAQVQEGTRTDACSYEWFHMCVVISKLLLHSFFNLEVSPVCRSETLFLSCVVCLYFLCDPTVPLPTRIGFFRSSHRCRRRSVAFSLCFHLSTRWCSCGTLQCRGILNATWKGLPQHLTSVLCHSPLLSVRLWFALP